MNRSRFVRRNRVDEPVALAIAAAFGVLAVLSGARPTGSLAVDIVFVFVGATAVVWAAASAQWWAVAGACGVGAVIALHPLVAAVGALGFLGGLNVGTWRQEQSRARSVIGGVAVNVLIRSELDGFFGLSAVIGLSVASGLFVLGVLRRPSAIRRRVWIGLGGVGGVTVVLTLATAIAVTSARPDLTNGARTARLALAAVNDGDYDRAAALFDEASVGFAGADDSLGGLLAAPSRLLPAIAQNVRVGADLSAAAADASEEAASALRQVDPSSLRVSDGAIDLAAIRAVEAPLERVRVALSDLRTVVDAADPAWLVPAVKEELIDLDDEFGEHEPRLQNAIDAVRLAPAMLGDEGRRRYLLLFTSPSEARGIGGFIGSFATVEVDQGNIDVTDFGRTAELSLRSAGADCSECGDELLAAYGKFGFTTGPDDTVGQVLWSNITMPAHFPYIAEAAAAVYPQAFGQPLDGVVVLDPYVVQALMRYSGPIPVPQLDVVVTPDDAAQFILADQYVLAGDDGTRVEALNALGTGAIRAILTGALPDPPTIARDLGPLIAERRLLMWTAEPDEQGLLDRVGLLGSIPPIDPADGGFSVAVTNAGGNKIDYFLDVTTDVSVDETELGRVLTADVTMRNDAPGGGLPEYVIGNFIDLPNGYSRLYVSFYGPPSMLSATLDGEVFPLGSATEAGWTAFSNYVDLAPGQTRTFRVTFALPNGETNGVGTAMPTLWEQPLAARR